MKFAALLLCMVALVSAFDRENDTLWKKFKEQYSKSYTVKEELSRRNYFEASLKRIGRHNLEADLGQHSYRLGLNQFSDLATEEFVQTYNGYKGSRVEGQITFQTHTTLKDLPKEVDWRNKGYVTPVKNQGGCGSCWAFSTTGSLEGQHFKKTGKLVSLSEQNLVDCSGTFGNQGCNGGLMDQAFNYIKSNGGIDTEESYPYTAKDGDCKFNSSTIGATVTGAVDIPSGNEAALQEAIATIGPISVAIDAGQDSFQAYSSGVYDEPACSTEELDHGVLVVGYGTEDGKDYYLVKNSWGPSWGDKGYIKMSRNKNNQCGIATQAVYPLV